MKAVGRIGSYISRSVYTVSGPFHPFGGAVDIIVVKQQDGSFKSSPWYVRFGKFQGVLKSTEKVVRVSVNGVEADFNMYLDNKGEAFFLKEVDFEEVGTLCSPPSSGEDTNAQCHSRRPPKSRSCSYDANDATSLGQIDLSNRKKVLARTNSKQARILGLVFGRKSTKESVSVEEDKSGIIRSESLQRAEIAADLLEVKWCTNLDSPRSKKESLSRLCSQQKRDSNDVVDLMVKDEHRDNMVDDSVNDILSGGSEQVYVETVETTGLLCQVNSLAENGLLRKEPSSIGELIENENAPMFPLDEDISENAIISSNSLENGFVTETYSETVTLEPVYGCGQTIESRSIVTISTISNTTCQTPGEQTGSEEDKQREYESAMKGAGGSIQLDILTSEISEQEQLLFGDLDDFKFSEVRKTEEPVSPEYDVNEADLQLSGIEAETDYRGTLKSVSSHIDILATTGAQSEASFRMARSLPNMSANNYSLSGSDPEPVSEIAVDSKATAENGLTNPAIGTATSNIGNEAENDLSTLRMNKTTTRSITPTSEQLASLNLKEGLNSIVFTFSTPMLGKQQVDARIFLWKWDARIVISDVDGTITRSDLLGQFMPLVGVDWSQTGVTHLFTAIKENGYQLLFLSARSISQAYHTRQFLCNLKQDGKILPEGPVVISPDGLFPSLYREVVRRAPHEFKIACLEDIKALFPADRSPFYAGFGNRDTDEISYLKVGIPRGKIFIINPKGEIVVNRRVDTKTYTSLHTLVHDMFPPMSSYEEQEDYNSWNFWKLPPPEI